MVRAILQGQKTQTRRVIKPQPDMPEGATKPYLSDGKLSTIVPKSAALWYWVTDQKKRPIRCPYGLPGDRLWVRETFYCDHAFAGEQRCVGCVECKCTPESRIAEWREELYYRADTPSGRFEDAGYWAEPGSHWRPSLHMPRWACRLELEITGVRVERMQDGGDREFWGEDQWAKNPWVWVIEFRRVVA